MSSTEIREKAYQWCRKYEMLFRVISVEEDLRNSLSHYSAYSAPKEHLGIYPILRECMKEAYEAGVVVPDYREIIEETGIENGMLQNPGEAWANSLTEDQILACIAWHFRRDHFCEGSWIAESVADGHMLVFVQSYLKKFEGK